MPELHPVRVVDVRVAAEHLAVDVADVGAEVWGEIGRFAEPGCVWVSGRGQRWCG